MFAALSRYDYEPRTHVLALGDGKAEHRYELDPAHGRVTPHADIPIHGDQGFFRLLDPALADGAVAIQSESDPNSGIEVFREEHGHLAAHRRGAVPGYVVAVDDRGHAYSHDPANTLFRDGAVVASGLAETPVVDHAGAAFVTLGGEGVTMYDASGQERWRQPIWSAYAATFTPDDQQLLVRAPGGLVLVDAASGHRSASACGWHFGVHDEAPASSPAGQGSVCEDSE